MIIKREGSSIELTEEELQEAYHAYQQKYHPDSVSLKDVLQSLEEYPELTLTKYKAMKLIKDRYYNERKDEKLC